MEDEATEAPRQRPEQAPGRSHIAAQQQPSMSQLAEDEELLALAIEDYLPHQDHTAPAEPSHTTERQQQPPTSYLAQDEQLLARSVGGEAPRQPLHLRNSSSLQEPDETRAPAARKQLGRLSQLSQPCAAQHEQHATGLEDADNQELLPLCDMDDEPEDKGAQSSSSLAPEHQQHLGAAGTVEDAKLLIVKAMDKVSTQLPQVAQQADLVEPSHPDSDEDDEEPLRFNRKKHVVLAD